MQSPPRRRCRRRRAARRRRGPAWYGTRRALPARPGPRRQRHAASPPRPHRVRSPREPDRCGKTPRYSAPGWRGSPGRWPDRSCTAPASPPRRSCRQARTRRPEGSSTGSRRHRRSAPDPREGSEWRSTSTSSLRPPGGTRAPPPDGAAAARRTATSPASTPHGTARCPCRSDEPTPATAARSGRGRRCNRRPTRS